MTARRKLDTSTQTPGLKFLRGVLADPKTSHADKMRAALALAGVEKAAATREFEPNKRQREEEAATRPTGTDWDELLGFSPK